MRVQKLLLLIASDFRRNKGLHIDRVRAKMLLIEFRIEQFIYQNLRETSFSIIWYVVRSIGSIYQLILCNSQIPGSLCAGQGLRLPHPQNIIIVGTATIGDYATIYQNTTIAWNGFNGKGTREQSAKIGNNVLIGTGAIIVGDVTIGDYVLVGAGTVVTRSVPAYSRITNAATVITSRPPSERAAKPGSAEHMEDPYSIYH